MCLTFYFKRLLRDLSGNTAVYKINILALLLLYQEVTNFPHMLCLSQLLFAVYVQFHHAPTENL